MMGGDIGAAGPMPGRTRLAVRPPRAHRSPMNRRGFTLLEMVVTLALIGLGMAISVSYFQDFRDRTAARRAADVFARDLQVARATALRERNTTSIVFDEAGLSYEVRTSEGRVIFVRDLGGSGEIRVQSLDLQLTGDSVPFDPRGIATLAGAGGSLATAVFTVGEHEFEVSFTALGAAEVTGNEDESGGGGGGGGGWK